MNKIYESLCMGNEIGQRYDDFSNEKLRLITCDTEITRCDDNYMSVRLLKAKFCIRIAFHNRAKDSEVKHAIEKGKKCLMKEIFSEFDNYLNRIEININNRDAEESLKSIADFRKFIYG